jgi:hypothetical protein
VNGAHAYSPSAIDFADAHGQSKSQIFPPSDRVDTGALSYCRGEGQVFPGSDFQAAKFIRDWLLGRNKVMKQQFV